MGSAALYGTIMKASLENGVWSGPRREEESEPLIHPFIQQMFHERVADLQGTAGNKSDIPF